MNQARLALAVLFGILPVFSACAQTWIQTLVAPVESGSFACSADGRKLVLADSSPVYTSTNYGINWITTTSPTVFLVASSADGNKLAAIGSVLCTSSDSGKTWTVQTGAKNVSSWSSIRSSADGSKLVASGFNGFIYTSTNAGIAWVTNIVPQHNWHSIASSADGSKLVAVIGYNDSGSIYVSTNSGAIWLPTDSPIANWYSVATSSDGNNIIAAAYGGGVYTSTNGGDSWISNSLPTSFWVSVSSSAAGTTLVASTDRGGLYVSTNSGVAWVVTNSIFPFFCTATSADGTKAFSKSLDSTGLRGVLYTMQLTPTPQLNLTTSGNRLAFSWLVPSTNFVLQQNLDLPTKIWVTLTNVPTLNLTNLQDEVIFSPNGSSRFYRLSTP
jgi:hypothetical protein